MRRDIVWHLLWPGLVATLIWVAVAILSWAALVQWLVAWVGGVPPGAWLMGSDVGAVAVVLLIKLGLILLFVPMAYVTAAFLVATVALPWMLERVARTDYAGLSMRRGGSNLGSLWNSLAAVGGFVGLLLLSLPLWLIPGAGLLVALLAGAWLNLRAFRYDALMLHADPGEMRRLHDLTRRDGFLVGIGGVLLAYLPFVNLLAPAFCGLAFVHFMLARLARLRAEEGVELLEAAAGLPALKTAAE